MSVLNQSGEEQVECPLCMEPLEVDDLNFYPCTCGYQICRFCWHRIRTDENGLCPACRKAYSENPADFTPLSKEQVAQLKAEKRQRDQQRKAKLSESRKHLASVRVVQKNLVFVVGLPVRLADADVLKRHEYFGKFGKIHKVVINQSTSYAGSQGPSASAYVTYVKSDDALRAIQNVNNIMLDGRLIKSSLGTTKYCSHFMKNQPCPKPDCMYLHDFGDPEASFTKEQMHLGKHQEYEKKLHDALVNRTAVQQQQTGGQSTGQQSLSGAQSTGGGGGQASAPVNINIVAGSHGHHNSENGHRKEQKQNGADRGQSSGNKDGNSWPTLSGSSASSSSSSTDSGFGSKSEKSVKESKLEKSQKGNKGNQKNKSSSNNNIDKKSDKSQVIKQQCEQNCIQPQQQTTQNHEKYVQKSSKDASPINDPTSECIENLSKMQLMDDNSSFFSHNTFQKIVPDQDSSSYSDSSSVTPHSNILNDNLPDISSSEDWEAAFGFSKKSDSPLEQNDLNPTSNRNSIVSENGLSNFGNGTQNNYDRSDSYNIKVTDKPYLDSYQKTQINNFTDNSSRDILEVLTRASQYNNQTNNRLAEQNDILLNSYVSLTLGNNKLQETNSGINGLDQQMSKFFAEFNKNSLLHNGFSHQGNNGYSTQHNPQEFLLLNQYQQRLAAAVAQQQDSRRTLEEQTAMLNLKQSLLFGPQQQRQFASQHNQTTVGVNAHGPQSFISNGSDHYNGQTNQNYPNNTGFNQNSVFQNQSLQRQALRGGSTVDDDLGFDPFHETQKALAELIESEQTVPQLQNSGLLNQNSLSGHNTNGAHPNGLLHNSVSNSGCLPPPPPGFLQHNTHMNSFGSKILPFLNMSNSQQISSQGGWTNNYSEAQLKGLAPVNDWTTLDPAIVSSSRHFPFVNLQPLREQYNSPFQQLPQQPSQLRAAYSDFQTNNTFANAYSNQHVQQNYQNNSFSHLGAQQNGLNWYGSELQNQISSPPGFRQTGVMAQSKTQEC